MVVMGIDPGLAYMGYAFMKLDRHDEDVLAVGVIRTSASPRKMRMRQADDVTRRVVEIVDELDRLMARHGPIAAVCTESFSPPRNASSAAKVAMAWGGVIGATSPPYLQASPQEIKIAVCGSKKASKDSVTAALSGRYGSCEDVWDTTPAGQRDHGWDALASIVACLTSPAIEMTRRNISIETDTRQHIGT